MAVQTLSYTVTGITNLTDIQVIEAHNNSVTQVIITCESTSLTVGDSITVHLGYSTGTTKVFTGYVRTVLQSYPVGEYTITCEDVLAKAAIHYMAAADPENPFSRSNILTQDLVEDLLNDAGITNYTHSVPLTVRWGTGSVPVEFNLINNMTAIETITKALAWKVFADRDGQVHLEDRKAYDMGGESASFTFDTSTGTTILNDSYSTSAENLRNRIVVYGNGGIHASASAVSPHLPSGFYQTAVIATPIIDTSSLANQVASLNLAAMNRLTEQISLTIVGNPDVRIRTFANVIDSRIGVSGKWYIYRVEHSFGDMGYKQSLILTR